MENNIFKFATKELSQDAFLCWLINWINLPTQENTEIKNLAKNFIDKLVSNSKNMKKNTI